MAAQMQNETKLNRDLPIGFLDSGLGGISVLKEAVKLMPRENFIYYGDSLHAPYGVRSAEEIRALTYAVVEKLLKMGIKGLAVACNTATSAAVRQLRLDYPDLPIVGIEPAVKPAVESSHGGRILVMATPMTIRQEKFQKLLARYQDQANIIPVPCEGLMEFVEKGDLESDFLNQYFWDVLFPFVTADTETIVLGCTHYPFLRPHLREFLCRMGQSVAGDGSGSTFSHIDLIDGSLGTARELKRRLARGELLREEEKENGSGWKQKDESMNNPHIVFLNSMLGQEMIDRSWKLLNLPIE